MKISEFASKAGVTVKTLLHYDKIGLLKPSQKLDSGYRIYNEEDFLRLQQIITLKFIGLSLNEIKEILSEKEENLEKIISIQKKALEEKKRHIEEVITVFNKAENQIRKEGFLGTQELIDIIKITNMEVKVKEQYITDEKLNLRFNLHSYNTNKTGWDRWFFNEISLPSRGKVLELGCGTGNLWYKNRHNINCNLDITLSDFSKGMLKNTKEKLHEVNHNFIYRQIDAQDIPYEDESFDVIIARHMLYLVPDIEKALSEIKRVLKKDGTCYISTNSCEAMKELNELVEKFDPKLGLHDNGMCYRFDLENGKPLLKKYFRRINMKILQGKIIVDRAEPVVQYKASTIKGSSLLVGNTKREFKKYIEDYIKGNGSISITTKAGIFKVKK